MWISAIEKKQEHKHEALRDKNVTNNYISITSKFWMTQTNSSRDNNFQSYLSGKREPTLYLLKKLNPLFKGSQPTVRSRCRDPQSTLWKRGRKDRRGRRGQGH